MIKYAAIFTIIFREMAALGQYSAATEHQYSRGLEAYIYFVTCGGYDDALLSNALKPTLIFERAKPYYKILKWGQKRSGQARFYQRKRGLSHFIYWRICGYFAALILIAQRHILFDFIIISSILTFRHQNQSTLQSGAWLPLYYHENIFINMLPKWQYYFSFDVASLLYTDIIFSKGEMVAGRANAQGICRPLFSMILYLYASIEVWCILYVSSFQLAYYYFYLLMISKWPLLSFDAYCVSSATINRRAMYSPRGREK